MRRYGSLRPDRVVIDQSPAAWAVREFTGFPIELWSFVSVWEIK